MAPTLAVSARRGHYVESWRAIRKHLALKVFQRQHKIIADFGGREGRGECIAYSPLIVGRDDIVS
jgi:hypothetical protein